MSNVTPCQTPCDVAQIPDPTTTSQRYKKNIKILGGNEKNNYLCIVKCSSRYSRHEKFAIKNVILK